MLNKWLTATFSALVHSPIRYQRRRRLKRIVARDGSAIVPSSKPQPDGTWSMQRARRWPKLLDEGVYTSVSEIAEAEGIRRS